eukprot:1105857-Rhodomonas_salina.1
MVAVRQQLLQSTFAGPQTCLGSQTRQCTCRDSPLALLPARCSGVSARVRSLWGSALRGFLLLSLSLFLLLRRLLLLLQHPRASGRAQPLLLFSTGGVGGCARRGQRRGGTRS